ncbi:mitochondrial carrier domain-containing protein, partial [Jimgerdemannia flammicorona]
RDTLGTSVYFGSYETVKRLLTTPTSPAGPLTHFLAGGLCGIFCWLVVFPIDLVKSVIQKEAMHPHPTHDSIPVVVREILARSGYRGFYRGLGVTLMRAFPIHSLNFLVYEQVLKMIRVDQREGDVGRAGT